MIPTLALTAMLSASVATSTPPPRPALAVSSTASIGPRERLPARVAPRADDDEGWAFPVPTLRVGERLPDFALPTTKSPVPVPVHDLIAGRRTILMVFASW